jgi:hypothetical protein
MTKAWRSKRPQRAVAVAGVWGVRTTRRQHWNTRRSGVLGRPLPGRQNLRTRIGFPFLGSRFPSSKAAVPDLWECTFAGGPPKTSALGAVPKIDPRFAISNDSAVILVERKKKVTSIPGT